MNILHREITYFFKRLLELEATLGHIESILNRDFKNIKNQFSKSSKLPPFLFGNSLVISDQTGPTDNGWQYNYPTGIHKTITFRNYTREIKEIVNREAGYSIAQSHEAFERRRHSGLW